MSRHSLHAENWPEPHSSCTENETDKNRLFNFNYLESNMLKVIGNTFS